MSTDDMRPITAAVHEVFGDYVSPQKVTALIEALERNGVVIVQKVLFEQLVHRDTPEPPHPPPT